MKYALVKDGEIIEFRHFQPNVDQSQLAEGKPRWLPVEIEGYAPFDPASEVRAGPTHTVDAERVIEEYTITPKGEDEIAAMKADKVAAIKAEAKRRIVAIMPEHQQTNWLAKATELTMRYGSDPAGWPAEWQDASRDVFERWAKIESVRARSNTLEDGLQALKTATDVDAFNPQSGWAA